MKVGRCFQIDIYFVYIDDIVDRDVLNEVKQRFLKIDIDVVIEVGMIEQLIEDDIFCLFLIIQYIERVDIVVVVIYEGRVVIFCDNINIVLIVLVIFMIFIQYVEDYYERWYIVMVIRILRVIVVLIVMMFQGFYIFILLFIFSMILFDLGFFIVVIREGVLILVFVEVLFLEFMFEFLREVGLRFLGLIGQIIGIVGGFIIG